MSLSLPFVKLKDGKYDWKDVQDAVYLLWKSEINPDIDHLSIELRSHYQNMHLTVTGLHTGINAGHKAIFASVTGTKSLWHSQAPRQAYVS